MPPQPKQSKRKPRALADSGDWLLPYIAAAFWRGLQRRKPEILKDTGELRNSGVDRAAGPDRTEVTIHTPPPGYAGTGSGGPWPSPQGAEQ